MRIVSQSKTMSFNFDEIMVRIQDSSIYACRGSEVRDNLIGSYESNDRAMEVFQDIHNQYCGMNHMVFQNIDISDVLLAEYRKNPKPLLISTQHENQKVEILPSVYLMPKE